MYQAITSIFNDIIKYPDLLDGTDKGNTYEAEAEILRKSTEVNNLINQPKINLQNTMSEIFGLAALIVTYYDKYFNVTYEKDDGDSNESTLRSTVEITASFRNMYPEYIPSGYTLINNKAGETRTNCVYIDLNNNSILYLQTIIDGSTSYDYDNEDVVIKPCNINGYDGLLIIKQNENTISLTWSDTNYAFSITGVLSEKEIIEMAESIS